MSRRTEQRRGDHESLSLEVPEHAQPVDEQVIQEEASMSLQKNLLAAVDSLGEPRRRTVLLRYLHGASVAEIAERTSVPPRTVESRLRRARAELRSLLDQSHGTRGAWLAITASAARLDSIPTKGPTAAAGSSAAANTLLLLMKLRWTDSVIGAFCLLALGITLHRAADGPARIELDGRDSALVATAPVLRNPGSDPRSDDGRQAAGGEELTVVPGEARVDPVPLEPIPFVGRVLGPTGEGLASIRVIMEGDAADSATSDAEGRFEMTLDGESATLRPGDTSWAIIFQREPYSNLISEGYGPLLGLAQGRRIEGRVVDPSGDPVDGASWSLTLPPDLSTRLDESMAFAKYASWSGIADHAGSFDLDAAPAVAGAVLTIEKAGFVPRSWADLRLDSDERSASGGRREFVLEPIDPKLLVRGVVLDGGGARVANAYVTLGVDSVVTQKNGEFTFVLEPNHRMRRGKRRLLAAAEGWRPGSFEPAIGPDGAGESWPEWVELQLKDRPLQISGVVLDGAGEPCPGVQVWLDDPTIVTKPGAKRMVSAESLGSESSELWQTFETDFSGRFTIPRLSDRSYLLRAMDPDTLLCSEPLMQEAGTKSAVLRLDVVDRQVNLEVEVVDPSGETVEGADVTVGRVTLKAWLPSSNRLQFAHASLPPLRTGEDGRCSFGLVSNQAPVYVDVFAEGYDRGHGSVAGQNLSFEGDVAVLRHVLRGYGRCQARVIDDSEIEGATSFSILGPDQKEVAMRVFLEDGGIRSTRLGSIVDGSSSVFGVSCAGKTLRFYRDGELLAERAIVLNAGEQLNVLKR